MLVYSVLLLPILLGVASLSVDYGHVQTVKTELQRCADATARGVLEQYAQSQTPDPTTIAGWNSVDQGSGISPSVSVTWGWWSSATNAFCTGSGSPVAVKVVVARTAAAGKAVPLTFALLSGSTFTRSGCDVSATSIAYLLPSQTSTVTVPGTADVWLAGMPAGSTASYNDTAAADAPPLAMTVTPGASISFSATGTVACNQSTSYSGPEGKSNSIGPHMQGSPDGDTNGLQNGIQNVTAPLDALIGVFLTNAAPNTVTPPATALNYTSAASRDQNACTAQVQQPFYVGDGQTSAAFTQRIVVPNGATRLYLGSFDNYGNSDNRGSYAVTATQSAKVVLVK